MPERAIEVSPVQPSVSSARGQLTVARHERSPVGRSFGLRLAALALAALGARLLYVLVISPNPYGIGADAAYYSAIANRIAHGYFFTVAVSGHTYAASEHVPLYPLVLSVVSVLGGTTILAHRILGCVLGAAAVIPVGRLGLRAGGNRAGMIAAAIAAAYPPFVTTSGADMSEPLFVLTVATALVLALRLRARPSLSGSIWLGGMVGLAALTRGEGLLMLPLLAWPASWTPAAGRWVRLATVTVMSALVIAPWVAHNWVTFHRLLLASDASELIAGANCHSTYHGQTIGGWSFNCAFKGATAVRGGARSRSAPVYANAVRYFQPDWKRWVDSADAQSRGIRYAENHLTRLPLVAAVRLLRTFDLYQPLDSQGFRPLRIAWFDELGFVCFFLILILAGFGLARSRGLRWLWLAPIWMTVLISVLGWGIARFRVEADISFIVLAAAVLANRRAGRVAWHGQRPV